LFKLSLPELAEFDEVPLEPLPSPSLDDVPFLSLLFVDEVPLLL
jgi:hypothetical protein